MKTLSTPLLACTLCAYLGIAMPAARAQEGLETQKLTALKKVARLKTLASKRKNLSAEVVYPVFRTPTRLARYANAQIRAAVVPPYRAWVKENTAEAATSSLRYDYQAAPDPAFFSTPRLLSTLINTYQFSGGAHGMALMIPLNYGTVAGKPKSLVLGDFFRPGTGYRKDVEAKIFAKLRKMPGTDWVQDGSVKTLETTQFNNFAVERDGLRWLFNQYEMGSYASGQFEVKLTAKELGAGFKREMLR